MTTYSDDFNSDPSADWVAWHTGGSDEWAWANNQMEAAGTNGYFYSYWEYDTAMSGVNHEVEVTVTDVPVRSNVYGGIFICSPGDNSTQTMIIAQIRGTGDVYRLYVIVDGSFTQLGSDSTETPADDDVMRLKRDGSSVTLYVNDSSVCSGTLSAQQISDLSGNKYGGIWYSSGNSLGVCEIDDFSISDVGAVSGRGRLTYKPIFINHGIVGRR